MGNFWPSLPIHIPWSPGIPLLWDIVWWLFQAVIMTGLLIFLRSVALRIDRVRDGRPSVGSTTTAEESERHTPTV